MRADATIRRIAVTDGPMLTALNRDGVACHAPRVMAPRMAAGFAAQAPSWPRG